MGFLVRVLLINVMMSNKFKAKCGARTGCAALAMTGAATMLSAGLLEVILLTLSLKL